LIIEDTVVYLWAIVSVLLVEMSLFFVLSMKKLDKLRKEKIWITKKGTYTFTSNGEWKP
jgi:hypothetical protein